MSFIKNQQSTKYLGWLMLKKFQKLKGEKKNGGSHLLLSSKNRKT